MNIETKVDFIYNYDVEIYGVLPYWTTGYLTGRIKYVNHPDKPTKVLFEIRRKRRLLPNKIYWVDETCISEESVETINECQ